MPKREKYHTKHLLLEINLMNKKSLFLLGLLGLMQGTAFLFIKIAVTSINPFAIVFLRVTISIPLIYAFIYYKKYNLIEIVKPYWKSLLLLSFTSIIIPFSLIAWAGKFIPSGISSVYMALIPIFVVIFEIFIRKNINLKIRAYLGLLLGFLGVILLFWNSLSSQNIGSLIGHFFCLLSAIFYGFSVFKTKELSSIPPIVISFFILLGASIFLFPIFVLISPENLSFINMQGLSILGLSIISTAGALMLMYHLIDKVGTVFTATTNYLVPLFGIILGYIFLNESLNIILFPAVILIFLSLYLVSSGKK